MHQIENQLRERSFARIAGVDEAGRGPIAGPVVAAAVIFPAGVDIPGVADSKLLTPERREALLPQIEAEALAVASFAIPAQTIDEINILQASLLAMRRALDALRSPPDFVLADGTHTPECDWPAEAVVKGDRRCFCIAAASIVAKVTRDRMMLEFHEQYPVYGFNRHKGYPTQHHIEIVRQYGPSPIHRRSFRVRALEGEPARQAGE